MTFALVALGAAVGAPLRYLTDRAIQARWGSRFPLGTLTVNVLGSFVLGVLVGLPAPAPVIAALGIGLCGAFTTFSTFTFESLRLWESRRPLAALANVVLTVLLSLAGATAGVVLVHLISG